MTWQQSETIRMNPVQEFFFPRPVHPIPPRPTDSPHLYTENMPASLMHPRNLAFSPIFENTLIGRVRDLQSHSTSAYHSPRDCQRRLSSNLEAPVSLSTVSLTDGITSTHLTVSLRELIHRLVGAISHLLVVLPHIRAVCLRGRFGPGVCRSGFCTLRAAQIRGRVRRR